VRAPPKATKGFAPGRLITWATQAPFSEARTANQPAAFFLLKNFIFSIFGKALIVGLHINKGSQVIVYCNKFTRMSKRYIKPAFNIQTARACARATSRSITSDRSNGIDRRTTTTTRRCNAAYRDGEAT